MTDLTRLASWLRCPVCELPLEPVDRLTLGCASGHRHDVNKRGYVSLLGGGSKFVGDTAEMLDARDAVLEGGAYAPIAAAVASAVTPAERVLDAGAGTGHYLRAVLAASPGAVGLAMDLSPTAVARAARSSADIDGLVADTWRPLPVRSHRVDAVLDVFAPRNLPEFHRVLRPGGTLAVVVPRADHLASLRAAGGMLDIPTDKAEDVITAAEALYAPLAREQVVYDLALDDALRRALAGMGPSARHADVAPAEADSTTVSVDVLTFTAR
ncbi:methyltransferase domain-containing protein [Leifsonia shinshuensis]|uniref:Methyltransferase domain-containing protein n=1 Tax=Leifsonia shinshuensis TaxID=150026 RepID=A0A7G6Y632_9MICO|nr:methyltransferase domain-containing protein [Leifsonia shinshuensis]QNE33947.1 methyltransferase domain-containing protein [Leifsonia shinshuensis]